METTTFYTGNLPPRAEKAVFDILCECDNEFYPPLSSRSSTTQKPLGEPEIKNERPTEYFNELKEQKFILVYIGTVLSAFLSYKITKENGGFYVSTLCVALHLRLAATSFICVRKRTMMFLLRSK